LGGVWLGPLAKVLLKQAMPLQSVAWNDASLKKAGDWQRLGEQVADFQALFIPNPFA
jgi:hypothetical protein